MHDRTKDLSKQSTPSYISIVPIVEFLFFIGKFTFFPQFFLCGTNLYASKSSAVIFGDSRMMLIRINQWTAEKPQRYFFSTQDTPPEEGWVYCYSFFGMSHPTKDTHLFQIQHKRLPCLRSKLVRTLLVDRNRELEQQLIEDHKKVVGGLAPNNSLEFFARYAPQNGLVQINCQDMQAPDRHKSEALLGVVLLVVCFLFFFCFLIALIFFCLLHSHVQTTGRVLVSKVPNVCFCLLVVECARVPRAT